MKAKLQETEDRKQRYIQEKKEKKERIQKEIEERKQRELERKQREEERKQREIERAKEREANLRNEEFDNYTKLVDALNDNAVGTNPLFDFIEQCEYLKRYCQKQSNQPNAEEAITEEQAKETSKKGNSELENALAKGKIQAADSKQETTFSLARGKKGKGKQQRKNQEGGDNSIDFNIIKKFSNLKLTVPLKDGDFTKTIEDLDQLREALIYWGKII